LTGRGEQTTVTCAWCGEPFTYVFKQGRVRRFHAEDHRDANGELTRCHWNYSNAQRRVRAQEAAAGEEARIRAAADARLAEALRDRTGLAITDEERADLLREVREGRLAMGLVLGRDPAKTPPEETLRDARGTFERNLAPLLERIEAALRR